MFPPYKYIITRILRNANKIYVKYVKNNRDFHTTKLNLPTGALDSKSSKDLLESLKLLNETEHTAILMVTHDAYTASYARRVIFIKDGKVFHELLKGTEERRSFFEQIMDVISLLGGDMNYAD